MSITPPQQKGGWGSIFCCFMHNCTVLAVAWKSYMVLNFHKTSFCLLFHVVLNSETVGYTAVCTGLGRHRGSCIMNWLAYIDSEQRALCLSSKPGNLGRESGRVYPVLKQQTSSSGVLTPTRACLAPAPWECSAGTFSSGKWLNSKAIQQKLGYNPSKCI